MKFMGARQSHLSVVHLVMFHFRATYTAVRESLSKTVSISECK